LDRLIKTVAAQLSPWHNINTMPTFKIITFGCRVNQYESQLYRDQLMEVGFSETCASQDEKNVDLIIINCCQVTEKARKEAKGKINAIVKEYSNAKIIVTGCLSKEEISKIKGIEIVDNTKKEKLVSSMYPNVDKNIKNFSGHTRAFIKIQDGCNSFCSYCIVPFLRGRSHIRAFDDIMQEIKGLLKKGFKEFLLTGINVGDFKDLPRLIKTINAMPEVERIRLSSLNVEHVDDLLFETILESKKFMPSLHLSLQSGSDKILKKMNRKYSSSFYLNIVEKFKKNKNFTFTTDIIVGFPGEEEEDFLASLQMIRRVGFIKVHIFPFSCKEGTLAATFTDIVKKEDILRRKKTMAQFAEDIAFQEREKFLGKEMVVLMESKGYGYSENYLSIRGLKGVKNEILKAKIVKNDKLGLFGENVYAY